MTKAGLVAHVAALMETSELAAERSVNAVLEAISNALESGESVKLVGFGVFEVAERAERVARNPKTNEEIRLPPVSIPVFRPGSGLKARVQKEGANA